MRVTHAIAIVIIFAAAVIPLSVTAGGFFVLKEGDSIRVKELMAFVLFDNGVEELVLSAQFDEVPDEIGWVVPLPAAPELTREEFFIFEQLAQTTERRQYRRSARGAHLRKHGGSEAYARNAFVATTASGIYDATIIEPADAGLLADWLGAQGFVLPEGAGDMIDRYNKDGWVLAAMKIRPGDWTRGDSLVHNTLEPVRFTFQSKRPVVPLTVDGSGEPIDVSLHLSSDPPQVPHSISWQSHIYSRAHGNVWLAGHPMGDAGDFLPGRREQLEQVADRIYEQAGLDWLAGDRRNLYLTTHRGQLLPDEANDVVFADYDPMSALSSPDSTVRWEAVTDLGLRAPDVAEDHLLQFLSRAKPGVETYVTLWALGRTGAADGEQALIKYLGSPDTEARLEAVEALATLGSRNALPYFVRGLEMTDADSPAPPRMVDMFLQRACFDHLIEYGDSTCLSDLEPLAEFYQGREKWDACATNRDPEQEFTLTGKEGGLDPGIIAVAAMCACDDRDATRQIVDAIVVGGLVEESVDAHESATPIGIAGPWGGRPALWNRGDNRPWTTLTWAHRLFDADRELRDYIYRQALDDQRLSAVSRIILIANLETPTDADIKTLMDYYERSTQPGSPTINVVDPTWQSMQACRRAAGLPVDTPEPAMIRLNPLACAVANALSHLERMDAVLELLAGAPASDPMVRGEIAFVMARTGDRRFNDAVFDYVRDVWVPGAAIPENLEAFESRPIDEVNWMSGARVLAAPVDLAYRIRPIEGYLFGDPDVAREIIADRDLHPYLRLRYLGPIALGREDLRAFALEELMLLDADHSPQDPVFGKLVDDILGGLDGAGE